MSVEMGVMQAGCRVNPSTLMGRVSVYDLRTQNRNVEKNSNMLRGER